MYKQVEKPKENRSRVTNSVAKKQSGSKSTFQFVDNRPEAVAQRKLQELANNSPQDANLRALQYLADANSVAQNKSNVKQGFGFVDNRTEVIAQRKLQTMADNRFQNVTPFQSQQIANQQAASIQLKRKKNKFRGLKLSLHELHSLSPEEIDRRLTMEMISSGKKNIRIKNSTFTNPLNGKETSFKQQTLLHLDQLSRTDVGHDFLKTLLATKKLIVVKQSTGGRNTTSTTSTGEKERLAQNPLVADWLAKRGQRILNNNIQNRAREKVAERNGGILVQEYKQAEVDARDEALAATDGRGTGSIVEVDPETQNYGDGAQTWQTERPKFGLYHELIHALHKGHGDEAKGSHNEVQNKEWQVLGEGPHATEPYTEATIRHAMGKEQRPDYSGIAY